MRNVVRHMIWGTMHYGSKQYDFETSKFLLSHERGSERSERASERVSGASERANGRASGPVLQSVFLAVIDHSGIHECLNTCLHE